MEIRDNEFSRQFEITVDGKMMSVEYSFQERKIFLTKINVPEDHTNQLDIINEFLNNIMAIAIERKLKVVPVHPKVAAFFKKNPKYKELLPPGIRL